MSTLYHGYPSLERVVLSRQDPRLKPAWLLRFWYLLQGLGPSPLREEVYSLWAPVGWSRSNMRQAIGKGEGLFWDRDEERLYPYSSQQLHAALETSPVTQIRFVEDLWGTAAEWHRSLVESTILSYRLHQGKTDPLSHREIAARMGISKNTVQRLLSRSTKIQSERQFLSLPIPFTPENLQHAREHWPHHRIEVLRQSDMLVRRLPNAYMTSSPPITEGVHVTTLGELLRRVSEPLQLDLEGTVWDGNYVVSLS